MFTKAMYQMGQPGTPPPQGGVRQVARQEQQQSKRDTQKDQQQAKCDTQKQAQAVAADDQKKTPGARGMNWKYAEKRYGVYAEAL
jgi:hypothetical protein